MEWKRIHEGVKLGGVGVGKIVLWGLNQGGVKARVGEKLE